MSPRLGVNIDHVATLRQARGGREPEPLAAALLAQSAGAHGITVHLRADRRHIQERDVRLLKDVLVVPLNVECAAAPDSIATVVTYQPQWATLVPETREELTTQGGLDVVFLQSHLRSVIRDLHSSDVRVSLFIDPSLDQVRMAAKLEVDAVELNTGLYADLPVGSDPSADLNRLRESARLATRLGMRVLAGHGLDLRNVSAIVAIPEVQELNIGYSIVGRSVLVGFEAAVREMLRAIRGETP